MIISVFKLTVFHQCIGPRVFLKLTKGQHLQEAKRLQHAFSDNLFRVSEQNTFHFGLKSVQYFATVTWNNIPDSL